MKEKMIYNDKDLTNIDKRKHAIELLEDWLQKLNEQVVIKKSK